jgi:Leucine-rich repeat (LRR) protein
MEMRSAKLLQSFNFSEFPFLIHLKLDRSTFNESPISIGDLRYLHRFEMINSHIIHVSHEVEFRVPLEKITLFNNDFRQIPFIYQRPEAVKEINISYNPLEALPTWICQCTNVEFIDLNGVNIRDLPEEFRNLQRLKRLYLDRWHGSGIPAVIQHLRNLECLAFSQDHLVEVPGWLGNLEKIKDLSVQDSSIESLPGSIGNLRNLEELHINKNKLKEIPAELSKCTNLRIVEAFNNQLTELGDWVRGLHKLEELSLLNNQIAKISEHIGSLTALRQLWLSNNCLTSLPHAFGNLKALEMLNLEETMIKDFPFEMTGLPDKLQIFLGDNSVNPEFQRVLRENRNLSCIQAIKKYVMSRQEAVKQPH